jgi:hypothetical protein
MMRFEVSEADRKMLRHTKTQMLRERWIAAVTRAGRLLIG